MNEWHKRKKRSEYEFKLEKQKAKLVPSLFSENANAVLKYLRLENHTGETLYKLYELMEGHPNQRKAFQLKFNISRDEFKRFGDAVHNPIISGELARHAYKDKTKSRNPMSFAEAQYFIEGLAKKWLKFQQNEYESK